MQAELPDIVLPPGLSGMLCVCAVLVMCDVLNPDGSPHETNTRAKLADLLTSDVTAQQPLYGFEQVRADMHTPHTQQQL